MEIISLEKDIPVICIKAASFPDGVMAAHQQLHEKVPFTIERRHFALSRPENGGSIIYKAAGEELSEGEAEHYHLERMVIKAGQYVSTVLHDYMKNIPAIGQTFQQLIAQPGIDPEGYCVEQYLNDKDLLLMVRLAD